MSESSPIKPANLAQQKVSYFLIVCAMVILISMFCMLCLMLDQNRPPQTEQDATLRSLLTIAAIASCCSSIVWLYMRTRGKIGDSPDKFLMSPKRFQTESTVALALSEGCAVFGLLMFFLGAPATKFVPYAAATLAVDVFVLVPRGLAYWSAAERLAAQQQAVGDAMGAD